MKKYYIQPQTNIISVELQGFIANSFGQDAGQESMNGGGSKGIFGDGDSQLGDESGSVWDD